MFIVPYLFGQALNSIGALKHAELTLGEMTIICGGNNTGKTYAIYALYSFLYLWRDLLSITIPQKKTSELLNNGIVTIDISPYITDIENILLDGCKKYSGQLSRILATSVDKLKEAKFSLTLYLDKDKHIEIKQQYERLISLSNRAQISITKKEENTDITITLLTEKHKVNFPPEIISKVICDAIKDIVFRRYFPTPFIASAERTGAAIFRKELNFDRNKLLKELSLFEKNIDTMELLLKSYQDYALPVEKDVDFIRKLEGLAKETGFLQEHHSDLLKNFASIITQSLKMISCISRQRKRT